MGIRFFLVCGLDWTLEIILYRKSFHTFFGGPSEGWLRDQRNRNFLKMYYWLL